MQNFATSGLAIREFQPPGRVLFCSREVEKKQLHRGRRSEKTMNYQTTQWAPRLGELLSACAIQWLNAP